MSVGIGITTRNRYEYLKLALMHFEKYGGIDDVFVFDDSSDVPDRNLDLCAAYGVSYKYSSERHGIAKAKNECLRFLQSYEHIFLFDDDCFPKQQGWRECFIGKKSHHLMHIVPFSHIAPVDEIGDIIAYNNCCGVCLYIDSLALDLVGGFDERFGIYGYEHAQYSQRIHKAGLTPYPYCAPKNCGDYIYSLDIDFGWHNIRPPLGEVTELYSSVTKAEAAKHVDFAYLMDDFTIEVPL